MSDDPQPPISDTRPPVFRIGGRVEVDLATPIASGAFCDIYRGWDVRARRDVAAKTLKPDYRDDPQQQTAFRREARLLAFLKHPNIIRVEAFVEEKGTFWAILEWLGGPSLKDQIQQNIPLRPEALVGPLEDIAEGLAHIHQRGLVHLDVQPENVLSDTDHHYKLIDLRRSLPSGTTVDPTSDDTVSGIVYLAPEQLTGGTVTPQTDIYALGCILYEALTATPPHISRDGTPTVAELRTARRSTAPIDPTRLRPNLGLPPWVDDVLRYALAPNPSSRYGDIETLARMFRMGVEGEFEQGRLDTPALARDLPPLEHQPIDRQWIQAPKLPVQPAAQHQTARPIIPPAPQRQRLAGGAPPATSASSSHPAAPTINHGTITTWLWRAVGVALGLNLLVLVLLLVNGDGVPPFSGPSVPTLHGGGTAIVITQPLVVRAEPRADAQPIGELGANTRLVLGEPPVSDGITVWWPVTLGSSGQVVTGYVAASSLAPVE